jgi:uncharacterized protein with von Willebrand factor type A (vWA) domain
MTEAEDAIRGALRQAVAKAVGEAQMGEDAVRCFGCGNQDAAIPQVSAGEKAKMAKVLADSPKIRRIMERAGRLSRIAERKQREKVTNARNVMDGVEQGDNLPDVLPSELALLADSELEAEFFRRYAESGLLQYRLSGKERIGKGPVIAAGDCSGSMSGTPDEWSKAMMLSLYLIARRQHRDFGIILFNASVQRHFYVKADEQKTDELINVLCAGCDGGTQFEPPLDKFLEYVEGQAPKADLVFITDGLAPLSPQFLAKWQEAKKRLQFSAYGIVIGFDGTGVMRQFCNEVIPLHKAIDQNEDAATDAAFSI